MKIIVDSKIPFAREAFADLGEVGVIDTQAITAQAVRDADALVVRSETRVDERLLAGSAVKFVGTSTIGFDHVDTSYLQARHIGFASAPGSNANSVGEYVVAALLALATRRKESLAGKTLGVVGVGNVGSIVVRFARALGMRVLKNDPPLARQTGDETYLPLDDILAADIVTLHVPLTMAGVDRTFHLFDEHRIGIMKRGSILINTSRGGVVDTEGLGRAIDSGHLSGTVLDVWEGEPGIDAGLLSRVSLGTPHIAGYSFDGKVNGVVMIQKAACAFFGAPSRWVPCTSPDPGSRRSVELSRGASGESALLDVIRTCYDIGIDDNDLRKLTGLPIAERPAYFRRLRAGYRLRREFPNSSVVATEGDTPLAGVLKALGFRIEHAGG